MFDPEVLTAEADLRQKALELLRSVLALHAYPMLRRVEGMWIAPAEPVVQ